MRASIGVALLGACVFVQSALAIGGVDCPAAGSGEAGVIAWSATHCGDDAECATVATTCNGQFTIELLDGYPKTVGNLVTFKYDVCELVAPMDLSHWSVGLAQIDCLGMGFDLEDLVVAATKNGNPVTFEVGLDQTTKLLGVKFNEGFEGTCNTYAVTFDTSVLATGYTLSTGCVTMSTKAGGQDITAGTFVPGYACGKGPVCQFDPDPPPACPPAEHNCFTEGEAGCSDVECCIVVCADDPSCCNVEWDGICVDAAKELCTGCGDPNAGDCCSANDTPFCNYRTCCDLVCNTAPECCEKGWDAFCAFLASGLCENCEPNKGSLVLSADDCQDDAFPDVDGQQIIVQLDMQNLSTDVTGFQAFILFDPEVLNYNGTLTSYTDSPFPLHITLEANALTGPGKLQFDGTVAANGDGTSEAAKLVSIVFDVKSKCETTIIGFGGSNFDSELSFEGVPIPTNLTDTDEISLDDNPPIIECPGDIKVPADLFVDGKFNPCLGAIVTYEAYAEDDCSNVTLEYNPPSGSFFPIGSTTVTVTATDKCGNEASCSFVVEVNATNKVSADVLLYGSDSAVRCILFVTDQCDINANVSVTFGEAGSGAKGTADFELPCGVYSFLCAKDEQHTLWATLPLWANPDTQCWELVPYEEFPLVDQLVLYPGDTDNDGDVDINDVTWLIATWGDPHASGGCPWDGTRDADFSNNGTVFTEDYSLLSEQWLKKSECLCLNGEGPQGVDGPRSILVGPLSPIARLADLDGNGVVDWRDVRIFEQRHGLPESLSRRMRTNN